MSEGPVGLVADEGDVVLIINGVRPARSLRASIIFRSGLWCSSDASTITAPFPATSHRKSLLPIARTPSSKCDASSGEQHVDLLDAGLRRGPAIPRSFLRVQFLAADGSIRSPLCSHVRTAPFSGSLRPVRSDVPPYSPRPAAVIPRSPLVPAIADPRQAVRQIPAGSPIALRFRGRPAAPQPRDRQIRPTGLCAFVC
jgi:hypothetical protein